MPYERPITIEEAVINIQKKIYLLPAIQREFVWNTTKIEILFDSLMRDYPIGTFLLWHIEKENSMDYQFYELIRDYHEANNTHNPKANVDGDKDLTAILDGQQRFTAFYLGLKGKYAYKIKGKRWDNALAFPERKLYLNILSPSENTDLEYDFRFLTDNEASKKTPKEYWFKVGEILDFKKEVDVANYPNRNNILKWGSDKVEFATSTLFKLYTVIRKDPVIHYFLEKDESIDKVLNIFIRVNSGGMQLDYSDLLLSIATAQWKEKDAREEIIQFVDEINTIGDGFDFDKNFVLKSCLVMSEITSIAFKVDNFNRDNMLKIEQAWDEITNAIRLAVNLVSSFGYYRDTLPSNAVLIPIAYYLLKSNRSAEFITSSKFKEDRGNINKWMVLSLLKRAFSGQPDNILGPIRQVIKDNNSKFPIEEIREKFKGKSKSIIFTDDDVEGLLENKYKGKHTFPVLAILYPTLDFRNKFDQDHIFPKSLFRYKDLVKRRFDRYKCEFYLENFDYIPNLQLIEGTPNQEKSNKDFKEWLELTYSSETERKDYIKKHYMPDVDFSFDNFEEFINCRRKLMVDALKTMLN